MDENDKQSYHSEWWIRMGTHQIYYYGDLKYWNLEKISREGVKIEKRQDNLVEGVWI